MRNFSKHFYGNYLGYKRGPFFSVPIMYPISPLEKFSEIPRKTDSSKEDNRKKHLIILRAVQDLLSSFKALCLNSFWVFFFSI